MQQALCKSADFTNKPKYLCENNGVFEVIFPSCNFEIFHFDPHYSININPWHLIFGLFRPIMEAS